MNPRRLFVASWMSIGTRGCSRSAVLPVMGARMDRYGAGAALQMVAVLGAILTLVFAGGWLRFQAQGGYRVVRISDSRVPTA